MNLCLGVLNKCMLQRVDILDIDNIACPLYGIQFLQLGDFVTQTKKQNIYSHFRPNNFLIGHSI